MRLFISMRWLALFILSLPLGLTVHAGDDSFEILFGGDTAFAKSYHDQYKAAGDTHVLEQKGYEYTIKNLLPILNRADHVILNLETPITHLERSEFDGEKGYVHYEDPDIAPKLLKDYGVDAVSLANNHTLDFAEEGLLHTMEYLQQQNIAVFGAGLNESDAQKPYVKDFEVNDHRFQLAVIGTFEYRKNYDKKYRFYADKDKPGSNTLTIEKTTQQIASVKEKYPDAFVVVYPHWGKNYVWKNQKQSEMAHAFIDAGADMVIGHGAHKVQEIEQYQGKWIVYSLGNFLFNTQGRFEMLNAEPYSMVGMLQLQPEGRALKASLRLYPIFSDNNLSNFQPYFLSKNQAKDFLKVMREKSANPGFKLKEDKRMGGTKYYIELPIEI